MLRTNFVLAACVLTFAASLSHAATCEDPLLIDLSGKGIFPTSAVDPVPFDLDGNGRKQLVTWTDPRFDTGILWIDLNHNRVVDSGRELFGNSMELIVFPGTFARTGQEALAQYDHPRLGGNGDGMISPGDAVWGKLRVWIDRNHDGIMQESEDYALPALGIESISLYFLTIEYDRQMDGHGNYHLASSTVVRRVHNPIGPPVTKTLVIEDVGLQVLSNP